jgi:hypothetical protein
MCRMIAYLFSPFVAGAPALVTPALLLAYAIACLAFYFEIRA